MKKIILSIISILSVIMILSGCNSSSLSGWTITKTVNGNGDAMEHYAVINVTTQKGGEILRENEIYLNVDGFKGDVEISMIFSYSSTITLQKEVKTTINSNEIKKDNGWHKVTELTSSVSYSYIEFVTKDSMNFNEIVILDENGNKLKLDIVKCGERPKRNSNSYSWEYTKAELETKVKDGQMSNTALCLVDEQEKFNIK